VPDLRQWRFEQLVTGNWVWERREDESFSRKGPFRSFEICLADAKQHGCDTGMPERRKKPRLSNATPAAPDEVEPV